MLQWLENYVNRENNLKENNCNEDIDNRGGVGRWHAVFISVLLLNLFWSVRTEGRLLAIFDRKLNENQLIFLILISVGEGHCHLKMCIFLNLNTHLSQQYASDQGFIITRISDCKFRPKINSLFFLQYTVLHSPVSMKTGVSEACLLLQIRGLQPINSFNVDKHLL